MSEESQSDKGEPCIWKEGMRKGRNEWREGRREKERKHEQQEPQQRMGQLESTEKQEAGDSLQLRAQHGEGRE
jgi:hypothetical protein